MSLIKNNVHILDGCVIGKKGFGFFPNKKVNYRYPQIGIVIIDDYAEIGCGSTIDRGSISNTIIGKNSFLDTCLCLITIGSYNYYLNYFGKLKYIENRRYQRER